MCPVSCDVSCSSPSSLVARRAAQAFLDNYSKYPMFSASDGRQSHEQLEEFDDARQARTVNIFTLTLNHPLLRPVCYMLSSCISAAARCTPTVANTRSAHSTAIIGRFAVLATCSGLERSHQPVKPVCLRRSSQRCQRSTRRVNTPTMCVNSTLGSDSAVQPPHSNSPLTLYPMLRGAWLCRSSGRKASTSMRQVQQRQPWTREYPRTRPPAARAYRAARPARLPWDAKNRRTPRQHDAGYTGARQVSWSMSSDFHRESFAAPGALDQF